MLRRPGKPFADVGAARLWAGPVLILLLGWRIDYAGDVAGGREHETHRSAEEPRANQHRLGGRNVVLAGGEIVDRHLDPLEVDRLASDLHLAAREIVVKIAIAQIERMV